MAQKRKQAAGEVEEAPQAAKAAGDGAYQVVARRFRPQSFEELVGQDEVLQSLRASLQQQRVPHAFLFSGSRGVGKTTSARILARCLNCEQGPTPAPCGVCGACRSILDGSNPDVMEIDAASNNAVDDVRRLRESVGFATMQSRYRVVILDEAHMMTKSAFNAFLKTLEEPPPQVVFVLATTEEHKVPDTIRSRCQVLRFRRVGEQDLQKRLQTIAGKEGIEIHADVLAEIAASVRGGVRDAETALERVLPLAREMGAGFDLDAYRTLTARIGTHAVLEVVAGLLEGEAGRGLHFAHDLQQQGSDEREALGEIVDMLRAMLVLKIDGDDSALVSLAGDVRERAAEIAKDTDLHKLDAMIGAGLLGRDRLRRLEDRGAVFEIALVRMAQAASMPVLAELLAQVRAGGGVAVAPPAARNLPAGGGGGAAPAATPRRGAPPRPSKPTQAAPPTPSAPATPATDADDLKARSLAALSDRRLLQATIELCRFEEPGGGGKLVVTLVSERKMHQDRLQSPVVQQELRDAIVGAAGREISVEFRVDAASAAGSSPQAGNHPPAAQPKPGEHTKRVLGKFGGRVVQVDPPDRVKPGDRKPQQVEEEEFLDPGEPPQD